MREPPENITHRTYMAGRCRQEERDTHMELFDMVKKLAVEEEGADATEYALLAALIAIALIVGARTLGTRINNVFNNVQGNM